MPSPTQRQLSNADVAAAVRESFGRDVEVAAAEPFGGGTFGAVWRVEFDDGRCVVLKAAPAAGAGLLRYESGLLGAEADYLRLVARQAPQVPTPRVLHQADEWLFLTLLPGTPLPDLPPATDTAAARFECGAAVARMHAVTGDRFGYPGARPHALSWPVAFTAMIEALLADAVDWQVTLPVDPARIRSAVAAHGSLLATVTTPVLLHFDLWDGNVLATADGHLSGLVDGERYLFGDPLVDFASPALFQDMLAEPDHPFLAGYRSVRPFTVDEGVRRRAWLYQLYLYLVMAVEFPSRGMTPATDGDRWARQAVLLDDLLARVGGAA